MHSTLLGEVCLIEADRDRGKSFRLTYSDFKEIALPLARALEDADSTPEIARHHHDESVEWLISVYASFTVRRASAVGLQTYRGEHFEPGAFEARVLVLSITFGWRSRRPPTSEDCDEDCAGHGSRWARSWQGHSGGKTQAQRLA